MKETIIGGVDVKRCKYLNKVVNEEPYCNIDEEHLYTCSSDENCYFKQLKRLEKENGLLKEKFKIVFDIDNQECWNIAFLNDEKGKYKTALEKIREINKEFFDMNYGFDEQGLSEDVKNIAHEIQDKINEVLNE